MVFTGYSLFAVSQAAGLTCSDMTFSDKFDSTVADRLREWNRPFVEEWHRVTSGLRPEAIFRPPAMLGEIGHEVDGVIVNNDTCTYQERISLIVKSGLLDWLKNRARSGKVRICEIGGGYGALCYWFKTALPEASYTIVDLPESLLFSRLYLTLTRPDLRMATGPDPETFDIRFVPNYRADSVNEAFDLVINTLSMSEMSEYQVRRYLAIMKKTWLRQGGLFFEQNQDNRQVGFLFAREIIGTVLPFRTELFDGAGGFRNGYPIIWSTGPIVLGDWRPKDPVSQLDISTGANLSARDASGSFRSSVRRKVGKVARQVFRRLGLR